MAVERMDGDMEVANGSSMNVEKGTASGPAIVEIAVQDAAGARVAREAGAARVEACSALEVGGLTPSLAMIEACVAEDIPVCVLVRPRAGDFVYDDGEAAIVADDVRWAVSRGAAAVVVGALREGAAGLELDVARLRQWAQAAREHNPEVDVVVHRCVDVLLGAGVSPAEVARQLAEVGGVTRVLTSGGKSHAGDGASVLAELKAELDRLGAGIAIMAGGGLALEAIPTLREAGIAEFHLSARREIPTGPTGPGGGESLRSVTDGATVRAVVAAAGR